MPTFLSDLSSFCPFLGEAFFFFKIIFVVFLGGEVRGRHSSLWLHEVLQIVNL